MLPTTRVAICVCSGVGNGRTSRTKQMSHSPHLERSAYKPKRQTCCMSPNFLIRLHAICFYLAVSTITPDLACCGHCFHTNFQGVWGLTSAAFVRSLYLFHPLPLVIPPLSSCCLVSIFSSCPHPQGFICICFPFVHSLSPWSNMWWTGKLIAFCGWDGWVRNQKPFFFFNHLQLFSELLNLHKTHRGMCSLSQTKSGSAPGEQLQGIICE